MSVVDNIVYKQCAWLNFGNSFLDLALLGCEAMHEETFNAKTAHDIKHLYIATIFNIKHGIEVHLKSLQIALEERDLSNKEFTHDTLKIWRNLAKIISKESKSIKRFLLNHIKKDKVLQEFITEEQLNKGKLDDMLLQAMSMVVDYYFCDFLRGKIDGHYMVMDVKNTAFKYPQNDCQIKLDYGEIIANTTKEDIEKIKKDVMYIEITFTLLWKFFSDYRENIRNEKGSK